MKKKKTTKFMRKSRNPNINRGLYMCVWQVFFLKRDRLVAFEGTLSHIQSQLQNIAFVFEKQSSSTCVPSAAALVAKLCILKHSSLDFSSITIWWHSEEKISASKNLLAQLLQIWLLCLLPWKVQGQQFWRANFCVFILLLIRRPHLIRGDHH